MLDDMLDRKLCATLNKRVGLALLFVFTISVMGACDAPVLPRYTPTPTTYIVTAMAARLDGNLIQDFGRCLRVAEFALVWPPDTQMTIEDGQVRVVSGIVSGNKREVVLALGEKITLGGGIAYHLDEQLRSTIPANCQGQYWVVGFTIKPAE
jgi:hypothetical protein